MRRLSLALIVPVVVLALSAAPLLLGADEGGLVLHPGAFFSAIGTYLQGLVSGESFSYQLGATERDFLTDAPRYVHGPRVGQEGS